ncbi:MAG: hypothetical protein KDA80_07540 [Planctomycetaceae bacterium]|nr:hypothetical protein [Planctomycetaceae bacterium]
MIFFRRCLFGLLFMFLGGTPLQAKEDPPLITRIESPGGGEVSYKFNVYDRLTLTNGIVYHIDPAWIQDTLMERGTDIEKSIQQEFKFYDFRGSNDTPVRVPKSLIGKFDYWEELAMIRAERLLTDNAIDDAEAMAEKVQEFNSDWNPDQVQDLLNRIRFKRAGRLLEDLGNEQDIQKGIALLEEVATAGANSLDLKGFQNKYESIYLGFAKHAREQGSYDAMRRAIQQIQDKYPDSKATLEFTRSVQSSAEQLMANAEQLAKTEEAGKAIDLAIESQRMAANDSDIRRRALGILRSLQRLRLACYETPGAFDPFNAALPIERQVQPLVFDRLVEPGGELGIEFFAGPLVESMRQRDGFHQEADGSFSITWDVTLKSGMTFSNGDPVSAGDVAGTIQLLKDDRNPNFDPEWDRLVLGAEVTGARTLIIRTRQFNKSESLLTIPVLPAKELVNIPRPGEAFALKPVGTGPFVVSSLRPQNLKTVLELDVNPHYHGTSDGRPYLKQIQFRRYSKKGTGQAIDDMERNEIEVISDPSPLQLARLMSAAGRYEVQPFLSDSVWVLAINHRRPAFQNRAMRLAMLRGINREGILNRWFSAGPVPGGSAVPQQSHALVSGPFPPQSTAYDRSLKVRDYDPDFAKKQLTGANLSGKTLTLKYASTGDLQLQRAMLEIIRDLEAAGLKVQEQPKLPNDFLKEVVQEHDFDLAYYRIDHNNILHNVAGLFDADPKELETGGSNFMGYVDQGLTQLFVDLRREQQVDRVWTIQHRIHGYFYNNVVFIPLWRLDSHVVHTRRLSGRNERGEAISLPIDRQQLFRRVDQWYVEPKL